MRLRRWQWKLSADLAARGRVSAYAPEQSLLVACLLTMSGGFLDAFTWLSLGGVFANSQTGNVVFLGMYAALGQWHEAAHHIPPILAFLAGAWVAVWCWEPHRMEILLAAARVRIGHFRRGRSSGRCPSLRRKQISERS